MTIIWLMDYKKETGKRIRQAREALGCTLEELSQASNGVFSPSRLGNWEQGTRRPNPEDAVRLAKLLKVSAAWILCVVEGDEASLLNNYLATDDRGKKNLLRFSEQESNYSIKPASGQN